MGVHDAPHCKTAVGVKNMRGSERELLLLEGSRVVVAFCVECGSSPQMRARARVHAQQMFARAAANALANTALKMYFFAKSVSLCR